MKFREWFFAIFFMIFCLTHTGCSSFNRKLKSWLGGGASNVATERPTSTQTKFSDTGDVLPNVRRQYKRTTKETLADSSALDAKTGSLWVMEGQGAYLFSQNVVRLVGDPLAITLEGDPRDQVKSKVDVIRELIAKIEERQKARLREPASAADEKGSEGKDDKKEKANPDQQQAASPDPKDSDLSVKTVPTRIVERTLEGNYRIKGLQPFMIGGREYKIIVTGIVRAEDFNEEGISATKLLDSKFDIVSARRKETEL